MTGREQVTEIEAATSSALRVSVGVPQGSILGPLWYILFTNELPEVIHLGNCPELREEVQESHVLDEGQEQEQVNWKPNFRKGDMECGALVCYADDSSANVSDVNVDELQQSISMQYSAVSRFLTSSKLQVNDSKTHTMLLTTSQFRRSRNIEMKVMIGSEEKTTSEVERLLGLQLHQNLKFGEHILYKDNSLIKYLNTRFNALQLIK